MPVTAFEQIRRAEVEQKAAYIAEQNGRIEIDAEEMKERVLAQFTKQLDAKIKNLQEGEGLAVNFSVDIIGKNGKVRGGSGSQRNMPEYIEWRTSVFTRDNYTCQKCGSHKDLNAHHIRSWHSHPDLRFDINNGLTVCRNCHAEIHPHIKLLR
jgi:hypothetical protein